MYEMSEQTKARLNRALKKRKQTELPQEGH